MNKYKILNDNFLKFGLKVFPVWNNSKEPKVATWQLNASSDPLQVAYWLENGDDPNFGLPAVANNLFIIDIDMHDGVNGIASFEKLLSSIGLKDVDTLRQKTPSGGTHLIFKSDSELDKVKNKANFFKDYPGIDVRTKGYILVEPSSINNIPYKLSGTAENIKEMPESLRKYILDINEVVSENDNKRVDFFEKNKLVERGNRDNEIFAYINYLYTKTRLGFDEISLLAHAYNEECFSPPLKDSDIDYKVRKIFERKRDKIVVIRLGDYDDEGK